MAISDDGHGTETSNGFLVATLGGSVDLSSLANNALHSDTRLVCADGKPLFGHAAILSLHSTWFLEETSDKFTLTGSDAGSGHDQTKPVFTLEFPSTDPRIFLHALRFLYSGSANIPNEDVLPVLHLSLHLRLERLTLLCVEYFEQWLLLPKTAILYANFLFNAREKGTHSGANDLASSFNKVAACLLMNVTDATQNLDAWSLMKGFSGDQICELCALVKSDPLVVWLLCISWICSVHGLQPSNETSHMLMCSTLNIPPEHLESAKQDLSDLLFILNLHCFSIQEYATYLEPHLNLFPLKTASRLQTHYTNKKRDTLALQHSLGILYSATQVLPHTVSSQLVSRISALQSKRGWTTEFKLIFTGSLCNFSNAKFHSSCNHRGPTLVAVKLQRGVGGGGIVGGIVGGYTDKSWTSDSVFHSSTDAFLFSSGSGVEDPLKFWRPTRPEGASLGSMCEAVCFGQRDLCVDERNCSSCLSVYKAECATADQVKLLGIDDFVDAKVEEYQVFTTVGAAL